MSTNQVKQGKRSCYLHYNQSRSDSGYSKQNNQKIDHFSVLERLAQPVPIIIEDYTIKRIE